MTDETESGPPQKTVAELLAQHGAQPEGGRRRRRRAADDEDEAPEPPRGRREPSVSDTAPQAIIDRVSGDTPPPPSRPPRRSRPQAPPDGFSAEKSTSNPGARPVPPTQQDSAPLPVPPNVASTPTRQTPPVRPPQEQSGYQQRPPQPPQQSGQFVRPAPPQEQSGYQQRPPQPPQQSGQFVRPTPPQEQSGYQQRPPDSEGLPPRGRPRPAGPEETRGAVPPVRRRPEPPAGPPSAGLSARLDGGADAPPEDVQDPPGPMASGAFATPPAQPARRRRPPARPAQPKAEPSTEQFAAVGDDTAPEAEAPVEPAAPPAGLAGWRKRRQKVQSEDTEIGGIPPVQPPVAPLEPDADPEQDPFDAGPPTQASSHQPHPAPMPFVPPHSLDDRERQDNLDEYEREFADPAYPDGGPDFGREEYGYRADDYEDDYDEQDADVVEEVEAEEPAENASPGKQWLALAGQLALGVVGGAGVWLGFNWLWVNIPAAALVAALLVIVALVWIVRKIRRAEDLQTTVLAVLVGLVVTVSPAALLLVAR
ncbi:hypothetical protein [Amycolatopsis sp. BJA-103]|uniref:hypothetical protein n=1 Tax=Amycolatopsis sp. BJA-103 TaxID=1911175 RepID=UPI000C7826C6|nr:hypothetical protein [Amycolatopsis sp. BJA-103]AUI63114.1 hypothetical protein BKN51_36520 [Amycolatopsis sp. BJA-103]PNE18958.1 hypothetical protein B1H26_14220 [Amycolatopsis sp. BJA-103]